MPPPALPGPPDPADAWCVEAVPFPQLDAAALSTWAGWSAALTGHDRVFSSPEYFRALSATHGPHELLVVTLRAAGSRGLQALMPLRRLRAPLDGHGLAGRLMRRRLRLWSLCGSAVVSPDPSLEAAPLTTLLHALGRLPGRFDGIEIPSMDAASPLRAWVDAPPPPQHPFRVLLPHGWRSCHVMPLPGSVEALLAGTPAKKRYNLARQQRQIERLTGAPLEVDPICAPEDLDRLARAAAAIGGTTALLSRSESVALAGQGLLRHYVLGCSTQPVAVVLGIPSGARYRVHRVLFNQTFAAHSPGTTALHALHKHLIAEGEFRQLDYGFGEPARRFGDHNQLVPRAHVLMLRPGLRNGVDRLAHRSLRRLETHGRRAVDWLAALRRGPRAAGSKR